MKQLIVHIEYDPGEIKAGDFELDLDDVLDRLCARYGTEDMGWRYFNSLNDACDWEDGKPLQDIPEIS